MTKFYLSFSRYLAVLLLFVTSLAVAQNRTVTGKVTAADDGSTLPGVNIQEKGTSNGAVTDSNGSFSITVGPNAVLVFSFVGFAQQEITVGSQTVIDVSMATDITALSEIVVIGYGQVEKKDLTGSVVSVSDKAFNRGVMSSPQDLIIGKVAGVAVTQGSGAPGSGAQIRIRGGSSLSASNDPLIVVDGFPLDNNGPAGTGNSLAAINPNDIETFTVLKDASATAIYGSRASNGVIIITTKKGRAGKPQLGYNYQMSLSTPTKMVDVLEGEEIRDLITDLNGTLGIDATSIYRLGAANTNWQNQIYRNAWSQDHNLSLSGTTKGIPYRVSYGFTDQQGILKGTDMKRHSVNLNLSPSFLDDNLKVNATLKASLTNSNFGNEGAIGNAVGFDPTQVVRNGNTRFGGYFAWTSGLIALPDGSQGMNINGNPNLLSGTNPVALNNLTNNQGEVKRLIGNLELDYRLPFLPEMRAHINMGIDNSDSEGYNNASTLLSNTNNQGRLTNYTGENQAKVFDFYLNYVKEFGEHKVDVTGGYAYQSFTRDGSNFSRTKTLSDYFAYDVDLSDETDPDGDTVALKNIPNPNYLVSFFGRANYSFRGKYLATATMRYDGSSRFAKENRWGLFPALALAWRIKDEGFLQSVSVLSDLKLRVGVGVTGQQDIGGTYPYLAQYVESNAAAQYQFGGQYYNTLRPSAYDAKIKWEETTTWNVGVDFGVFAGRLTGTLDYYFRETKDLINFVPVAAGSNFSNYLTTNVGNLENTGIELTLNGQVIKSTDFNVNVGFNIAHNKNEITKLTATDDPTYPGVYVGGISGGVGNTVQIHQVGHPASSFYVYKQVYDPNGKPIEGLYVDKTGNGGSVTADINNRFFYKNPAPKILMGINSQVSYKSWDFSFSGRFSFGNYVYNNGASNTFYGALYGTTGYINNLRESIKDTEFTNPQYWSSHFVENASFFKMDNMSLGYSFSELMDNKLKARVSFTVQNAFMVTKYSGIDPEVAGGIDNNLYPRPQVFLFGVNLTY
jgi:TonB-linked SusC/RagA family outer membrane protein